MKFLVFRSKKNLLDFIKSNLFHMAFSNFVKSALIFFEYFFHHSKISNDAKGAFTKSDLKKINAALALKISNDQIYNMIKYFSTV